MIFSSLNYRTSSLQLVVVKILEAALEIIRLMSKVRSSIKKLERSCEAFRENGFIERNRSRESFVRSTLNYCYLFFCVTAPLHSIFNFRHSPHHDNISNPY